jgi:hypothetical protein
MSVAWPALPPLGDWRGSCEALHLRCQMVGKYRLARTPWQPQSWHATLYVVPAGLATGPIPDGEGTIEITVDLHEHRLTARSSGGRTAGFPLGVGSIAGFDAQLRETVAAVGGTPRWHGAPNEVEDPVPFAKDGAERPWDRDAIGRFHQALVRIDRVFAEHRTGFLGKVSPSHLFWGSFDLAVTRFSGRRAPLHPGGIPNLPDAVTREAYSHEVQSSGFWPGGGPSEDAAFYAYAYPKPEGFEASNLGPDVVWSKEAGEFVLPYEAVRASADPRARLLGFLDAAYDAAARLGDWDRGALDCAYGKPQVVRPLTTA